MRGAGWLGCGRPAHLALPTCAVGRRPDGGGTSRLQAPQLGDLAQGRLHSGPQFPRLHVRRRAGRRISRLRSSSGEPLPGQRGRPALQPQPAPRPRPGQPRPHGWAAAGGLRAPAARGRLDSARGWHGRLRGRGTACAQPRPPFPRAGQLARGSGCADEARRTELSDGGDPGPSPTRKSGKSRPILSS